MTFDTENIDELLENYDLIDIDIEIDVEKFYSKPVVIKRAGISSFTNSTEQEQSIPTIRAYYDRKPKEKSEKTESNEVVIYDIKKIKIDETERLKRANEEREQMRQDRLRNEIRRIDKNIKMYEGFKSKHANKLTEIQIELDKITSVNKRYSGADLLKLTDRINKIQKRKDIAKSNFIRYDDKISKLSKKLELLGTL